MCAAAAISAVWPHSVRERGVETDRNLPRYYLESKDRLVYRQGPPAPYTHMHSVEPGRHSLCGTFVALSPLVGSKRA